MLDERNFSIGDESGGVGGRLPGGRMRAGGITDDRRKRQFLRQTSQFPFVSVNELRAFDEIEGKVPAQAELGEHREVRSQPLGASGKIQNFCGISGKVSYGWIELRERDFHGRPIEYGP